MLLKLVLEINKDQQSPDDIVLHFIVRCIIVVVEVSATSKARLYGKQLIFLGSAFWLVRYRTRRRVEERGGGEVDALEVRLALGERLHSDGGMCITVSISSSLASIRLLY